jgi:hypothetical protein
MYLAVILGVPTVAVAALTAYAWWGWGKSAIVTAKWLEDYERRTGQKGYQQ